MKLLQSITVFAFLLSTTFSCAQWKKIKGDGNITTINRSTGSYEGLKAAGPMDFRLVEGKEGSISIKGDANLMDYIITEVKDNKLVVKVKDGVNLKPSQTIVVTVPYESINYVALAGSGDIENSGTITADTFKVALAGSGDFDGKSLESTNVTAKITGSGGANVVCNGDLNVRITGSGDVNYSGKPTSKNTKVTGSGSVSN